MKKKLTAMAMVLVLGATAAIGGTLAYFTDTDAQKNVMTTGNVDISQDEQQQGENGLEDFKQNKPLMPMVDGRADGDDVVVNGYFNAKMENVVDKIVTVKNEAKKDAVNQDAYVRTILAFETKTSYKAGSTTEVDTDAKTIFDKYIGTLGDFELLKRGVITVDGVEYVLAVKVYDKALAPQEVSDPSLKQIFLAPTADNEVANLFGTDYTILAVSQGTQTAGFSSAAEALDTAFGDLETVSEETLVEWLSACVAE